MGHKFSNVLPLALIIGLVAAIAFFMVLFSRSFVGAFSSPINPADQSYSPLISNSISGKAQALDELRNFSFSTAAPIAGIPAISIPCGFSSPSVCR